MAEQKNDNPEAAVEGASAPSSTDAERIAALEADIAEQKDRILRAHAEMENLRRRTARELTEGRQYAVTSFARELLGVADNLRRALETLPKEGEAEGPARAFVEGVEMTERELQRVLAKHGVKPIEAAGQKFDPNMHQAMFEVEDAGVPAGTVVQVLQGGYAIGERVLRPAMVGVSKGGAKAAPKPADTKAEEAKPSAGEASAETAGKQD
jgi:molecular chaperone GrpE